MDDCSHKDQFGQMTKHAATRCSQRGIRTEIVDLVLSHFDRDHHAGAAATAVSISKRRLSELQTSGVSAAVIDQASRTILIIGDDGTIVTMINRPNWFARFHYGADRLGHRHRLQRRSRNSRSPR